MGHPSEQVKDIISTSWMVILAFIVGILSGFGALVFRAMIGFVHNLSFNGTFSFVHDADKHTQASVWGWGIVLVLVIGSVIVTWLTHKIAKEAKGRGVPEVLNAIYYQGGKIPALVAGVKAIASAISIGTGGSAGREGPIIQIGAAVGSVFGQIMNLSHRQKVVLIAAGGAAGIAATFNAPIGGLTFAMELLLISISAVNVALVAVATVTATMISRIFIGVGPSFFVKNISLVLHYPMHPIILLLFVPFAIIVGLSAALFIHSIYWFEKGFDRVFKNPYVRHMVGMFFLGLMLYLLLRFTGSYYVDGVSYAAILDILNGVLSSPGLLCLLFICKLLATSLTLGSGASGGVFSPSIFLGACLGSLFALFMQHLFPGLEIRASLFAVAGMAAMVGGTTGAVVTAIVMTFEQTRDYADILPIMLTVALAYAVRVKITSESIYTLKLLRLGKILPQGLQAAISGNKKAKHLMKTNFICISEDNLTQCLEKQKHTDMSTCIIISAEDDKVIGTVRHDLAYLRSDVDANKLIDKQFCIVNTETTWPEILRTMQEQKANLILVSRIENGQCSDDIVGVITQRELLASSQETAQLLD